MTGRRGKPAPERCVRGGAERGAGAWQIEREGEMREGGGAGKERRERIGLGCEGNEARSLSSAGIGGMRRFRI